MTPQEFQDAAREAAQHTHMLAATRLAEFAADEDADIEIIRKIYNDTKDVAGAVPDKKIDPNAGLAVFNITWVNGAMQATVEPAPLGVVQEVEPPTLELSDSATILVPSPAMLAATDINADLAGLR